jgi:hypothetical protein
MELTKPGEVKSFEKNEKNEMSRRRTGQLEITNIEKNK